MLARTLPDSRQQDAKALRKKVLADESTAEIARNLGISTDEYVDQVMHLLLRPLEEPWLYVVEDHELRALGLEPPALEEMRRFVMEAARQGEAAEERQEGPRPSLVLRFAQSPFSRKLVNVELSALTADPSDILASGRALLGRHGGGKLLGLFKSFASRFLGPVQSFLSKPGLWCIAGFVGSAAHPDQLLSMARVLFGTRQRAPTPDDSTRQIIQHNLTQLFARRHAQLAA